MMLTLVRLPQPVIARVQGVAVAAGCQLVSMCDLAVAADVARFALPGITSGIFCTTPGVGVARNLARKHALEMLFTGDQIDAATAERWGLVNRVVPLPELDQAVGALAHRVASHSPAVVKLGKLFFYEQVEKGIADAYALLRGHGVQHTRGCGRGHRRIHRQTPAGLEEPLAASASAARARPSPP
jgi:enoyl-CoA hydratase/carnithine racemase